MQSSKDRLEEFINNHRAEFEQEVPSVQIWNNIEAKLHPRSGTNLRPWLIAATMLFAIGVAGFYFLNQQQIASDDLSDISPELKKAEEQYYSKVKEFQSTPMNSFVSDLTKDDPEILQMKKDFAELPTSQQHQMIQWMILHYQRKIQSFDNLSNNNFVRHDTEKKGI